MAQNRPGRHINMLVEPFCFISAESQTKRSHFDPNQHFFKIEKCTHVFPKNLFDPKLKLSFPGRCNKNISGIGRHGSKQAETRPEWMRMPPGWHFHQFWTPSWAKKQLKISKIVKKSNIRRTSYFSPFLL